ncbi:MAG: methyltransferase domain-containing protein [Candidatus Methanofastidiosia archaeon]
MDEIEIRKGVRDGYARLAKRKSSCCDSAENIFTGYTKEQLSEIPTEATEISAGCGNPTALTELKKGQTILDLGSGGGIDVFLASRAVGPSGKAIGVDATPEMVWRARETAKKNNIENV